MSRSVLLIHFVPSYLNTCPLVALVISTSFISLRLGNKVGRTNIEPFEPELSTTAIGIRGFGDSGTVSVNDPSAVVLIYKISPAS